MRNLTEFIFFKNTPFNDFQNTIHFNNKEERDRFFLSLQPYDKIVYPNSNFNWIRDRQRTIINIDYQTFLGVNYCTFISDFEPNIRYYAHVVDYRYLNDNAIEVDILIDGVMTFFQAEEIEKMNGLTVFRSHLNKFDYLRNIDYLKNNDDIIKTYTKSYTYEDFIKFDEFDVIIHSNADLTKDFGDVDNPKINTPEGQTYDKITSPVDLYVIKQRDFKNFMKSLSPYPWISQNISKIILIPSNVLKGRYDKVSMTSTDFDGLYKLRNNDETLPFLDDDLQKFNKSIEELREIFGLKEDEEHLLRNEYTTTELYNYDGQALYIDNGLLNRKTGLEFRTKLIAGYHNELAIFPADYKTSNTTVNKSDIFGSFLNDALFIRNFDSVPILIDNYNLSLSQTAHRRELTESRQISNRFKTIIDPNADIKDRFFNAVSIASNISPMMLFSKFNDEHNFYKQQQAELADMALQSNTVTDQTNNNSLAVANDFFGIHLKHAQPNEEEWENIKKYYKLFGFELNKYHSKIKTRTQNIADYVSFTGSFNFPNIPLPILEMTKARFENGIRLWHNNNTSNPMTQNILNNTFRG